MDNFIEWLANKGHLNIKSFSIKQIIDSGILTNEKMNELFVEYIKEEPSDWPDY